MNTIHPVQRFGIVLTSLVFGLVWPSLACGQAISTAQISGTVRDPSGAVLPGVDVTATRTDTGAVRSTLSNEVGAFSLPNLPVGPYRIEVALSGFRTYVQTGIILQVNSNPVIAVVLEVGSVSDQVEVRADAPMIETQTTGVGQVIDNQRIIELPLNGRQATELIFLSGAATPAPAGDLNTAKNYPTVTISIAGGAAPTIAYVMDGGTHNDPFNSLNLPIPFPDALQEFKVETSAVPARYGHHSSGAVNIITKSGGNELHGDAFEFVRNGMFNARNAFALRRDTLKRNQFGGTLGGPIIPNKMFFFTGYQGTITRSDPSTSISYVPTPAMLSGDFTAIASAACNGNRAVTLRGPFVDNQVSPTAFDPAAIKLLQYVPRSDDPCGKFQYGILDQSREHQAIGKIDYTIDARHSIFGRYYIANFYNPPFYDGKDVLTTTRNGVADLVQSFVLGDTFVFSPNTISSFHGTVNRTRVDRTVAPFFNPADLGIKVDSPLPKYMNVSVNSAFNVAGGAVNPGYFNTTSFQLAEDFDLIRGSHQFSFGVNWIHAIYNTVNHRVTNGSYSFTSQSTGLSLADFMLGRLNTFNQGNPQLDNQRNDYVGFYFQDSWKVKPTLSVNAGIRWDPYFPMRNPFGWVSHFDPIGFAQGRRSSVYTKAPPGLSFPGDEGFPGKSMTFKKWADVAPRVGLVWDPRGDGRQTVRASYGIFYDLPHLLFNIRIANTAPWGSTINLTNPTGGFSDPYRDYPGGSPFPALRALTRDADFPLSGIYVTFPFHAQPTYVQQWNLSLQKQIRENWMVAASYLGNQTVHLWTGTELNPAIYIPGGSTTGNTNQRRQLSLQNPTAGAYFATVTALDDGGVANYQGLLVSTQRRMTNNFTVMANHTWSHCIADALTTEITGASYTIPGNRAADHSNCPTDRRHVSNISLVVQSPSFARKALKAIAGGWQLSSTFSAQTGGYFSVTTGVDNALTGAPSQRPNQVLASPYASDRTVDHWLNSAAFTAAGPGTYGNLGANNIIGPGSFVMNLGLSRKFAVLERSRLEARAEAFNLLNHTNPGNPISTLSSAQFGTITTARDPRILQFALKYVF